MKTTTTKTDTTAAPTSFFASMTREKLLEWLQDNIEGAARHIEEITESAQSGSLAYTEQNIENAAKSKVWARVRDWLTEKPATSTDDVKALALNEALRYARYNHHSTSLISNMCAAAEASAWAELVERCGGV